MRRRKYLMSEDGDDLDPQYHVLSVCYEWNQTVKDLLDDAPVSEEDFLQDIRTSESACKLLRGYLKANKHKLFYPNEDKTTLQNPDYLAFIMAFCSNWQTYNSWGDMSDDLKNPYDNGHIAPINMVHTATCACSHALQKIFKYTNPHTDCFFPIGRFCIFTTFILSECEKELIKQSFLRTCKTCRKSKVEFNSAGKLMSCKSCARNKRRCERCEYYNIPKREPEWKKICSRCFAIEKNEENTLIGKGVCFVHV
jgi:hypothetical protein